MRNIYNDIIEERDYELQDPATIYMIGISRFNNEINKVIIYIVIFVIYIIIYRYITRRGLIYIKYYNHSTKLEFIWTIIPALILIYLAIPSFKLLYALDEILNPELTVKVKGAQWFWSYEISDIENKNINFDSYTLSIDDLDSSKPFRLLDVDNPLVLPVYTPIRLLITSEDVIHSFAVPSFGLKLDAIPGRLNATSLFILRPGIFYGQCSELCGISHYNMSIVINAVSKSSFLSWISSL